MKLFKLMIFSLVLLISCNPTSKLIDRGEYDEAINLALQKLRGKRNKKAEFVYDLERAFYNANRRDMKAIENLKREEMEENWIKINKIAQTIRKRQDKIQPLLPLIDENGKEAKFRFVRIEDIERESKEKTADYFYNRAQDLLKQAEGGDKEAAREAFFELDKIEKYYRNFRDKDQLKRLAQKLGTNYVLVRMENNSNSILPRGFEGAIKKMSVRDLNSNWTQYFMNPQAQQNFDYTIVMNLREINVSRESEKEREYVDDKEVGDGYQYVFDKNGNVMKDSLGNDIKVPKTKFIKATIFEVYQHKAAFVGGNLDFIDNNTRDLVHTEPLAVEAVFENYAARFEGDKRALTDESKSKIGNQPRRFPTDENLILDAADKLKQIVRNEIRRNRVIR